MSLHPEAFARSFADRLRTIAGVESVDLQTPFHLDFGVWWMDIKGAGQNLQVIWSPRRGFGGSDFAIPGEGFGTLCDIFFDDEESCVSWVRFALEQRDIHDGWNDFVSPSGLLCGSTLDITKTRNDALTR